MLEALPLKEMVEKRSVSIKMHLGGGLGYNTIHPIFVRILVEALKNAGGNVFITDVYPKEVLNGMRSYATTVKDA